MLLKTPYSPRIFQKVLPSLELKRMQLSAEHKRAQKQLEFDRAEVVRLRDEIAKQLPMLAYRQILLKGLVKVKRLDVGEENLVGVRLPVLGEIDFDLFRSLVSRTGTAAPRISSSRRSKAASSAPTVRSSTAARRRRRR